MEKVIIPDTGKSQITPAVTVRIPMPPGAAIAAEAAPALSDQLGAPSIIMPSVTARIPMPQGAAIPVQAAPQNVPLAAGRLGVSGKTE